VKLESWRAGELESWRAGELESWRAGELESWRAGELDYYLSLGTSPFNTFCIQSSFTIVPTATSRRTKSGLVFQQRSVPVISNDEVRSKLSQGEDRSRSEAFYRTQSVLVLKCKKPVASATGF